MKVAWEESFVDFLKKELQKNALIQDSEIVFKSKIQVPSKCRKWVFLTTHFDVSIGKI